MKIKLVGLDENMVEAVKGLEELLDFQLYKDYELKEEEVEVIKVSTLSKESENVIEVLKGEIRYKDKHHFFRALSLYLDFVKRGEESFNKNEKVYIDSVGLMIDLSRNAVYRVSELKKILGYLALMGYKKLMLYTEDTYEMAKYPYFGYMRGRYSKEEIKEVDNYAASLGIELIPCIQTLAHLKQTLKWSYGKDIKDTPDILLVGEEKTYEFIEEMFSSLRESFRSKNIHIGMDEAFTLGRGEYLNKNGYEDNKEIMIKHLKRVNEIAKKYDFKPMIWDDMFLRSGAKEGGYYDLDIVITPEISNNIPKEVSLVYWDYYNSSISKYRRLLDIRDAFNNPIIFAGGCWRWSGFAPNYSKTFETTRAALRACKDKGIGEVFATAWGDDGSETPIYSIMAGLILFAENGYYNEVEDEWISKRCKALTGHSLEDFTSLEELDLVKTVEYPNMEVCNPSKYIAYQDLLLGAFDKHLEGLDLENHYANLAKKYEDIGERSEKFRDMFIFYSKFAAYLSLKSEIGLEIRKAYLEGDKDALRLIAYNFIPEIEEKLKNFHRSFRKLWYKECKGQGFEVIDIRLGGVMARCESTIYRLKAYLKGDIKEIEELEEERLYYNENFREDCKLICLNEYKNIATQNILSW